ncbi:MULTISPECIES: type II secretion system protein GspL [Aliiglaciecola]|uniref:type II secretion system protein GspL n=1 Tax=Aliiglaciecola TaxID=1406885 RepID=UPI001C08E70C|nr:MULTISPECIES: type II secretion system protein GspL [Aliiglaciecola]MBU2877524.1 type II secretion system protein GspL [Aliiglaciecola lipolytica]MDO6711104.1 type II secretion system protein GspL [Aliiglaciecola sp. 2_MG-2023]MDO6752018.1 type II secretion system protein GspL [Aliiglaciecola sp. 1_MG-2023]
MEHLVIRLGSTTSDPVNWLVWSGQEQEIIASGVLDNAEQLNSLSERAGKRPITALVPGCDFLLKWVAMPAKASRKALTAIPYMLEEDLSMDISEQFFALGEKNGNMQAVAVVSRDKMANWLEVIKQAGLYCNKMLPDILALPYIEDAWSLVTLGQQAIIRQDQWQGLQGDATWLLQATEHFAKQQTTPLKVANHSDLDISNLANVEQIEQQLDLPMQLLATGALKTTFNLLQGEFKAKQQSRSQWRQWRVAAVLAILALVVTLVDKGVQVNQLKQQGADLTKQMHEQFAKAFPNQPKPTRIRLAMERELAKLANGGGQTSMLAMMSQLTEAFQNSDVKPQTIRFDSARSELRLQAVAANFEALERFKRLAQEKGFEVQQGAINNKDNQVIGSLSIRS